MDTTLTDRSRSSAEESAATIVAQGNQIRQRIHELTSSAIRDRNLRMDEVQDLVQEIFHGATEGLQSAMPSNPDSALRQVFDGVSDAVAATVHAAKTSLDFARQRKEHLADRDLKRTMRAAGDAEQRFLEAVSAFAGKVAGATRATLNELVARAREAGTSIRPAASSVLRAARDHPSELIEQTVTTGMDVAKKAAGSLFMAAGGLLAGVGEGISAPPTKRGKTSSRSGRGPAASSAAGKSRASASKSAAGSRTGSKKSVKASAKAAKKTAKKAAKKTGKKATARKSGVKRAAAKSKSKAGSKKVAKRRR